MRKPILYMLCGIPGSGKSTWAADFIKAYRDEQPEEIRYVSRDLIRFELVGPQEAYFSHEEEVFHKFSSTIAKCLREHCDVIADATHLNEKSRAKLIRAIDTIFSNYIITYIYFNIPVESCLERNAKREGRARVPEEAIRMMAHNLRKPTAGEDPRSVGIWEIGAF